MANMTIKQCMDTALKLINQYTIAGSIVSDSYNDQGDDKNRMISLINDAQMTIATTVKPINANVQYVVLEKKSNDPVVPISFDMPEDFNHPIAVYFTSTNHGVTTTVDSSKYKWIGENTIMLPDRPAGTYRIEYNRFPVFYPDDVDTSTELDNSPDTHIIIPYFVGAMIALDDNPKAYYSLYNVWETRLARLGYRPAHAEASTNTDVYNFNHFGGGY